MQEHKQMDSELRLLRYTADQKKVWDSFIRSSKNGLFLFLRDYMDYHQDRFSDHSLLVYKKEILIALLPANETQETIVSHGGLTFGGFVFSFDTKAHETISMFEEVKNYYKNKGFKNLIYKSVPYIFHKYPSQEDLYAIFLQNGVITRRDVSSVVDLEKPIRFSETKRQAVAKLQKQNIIVAESDNFDQYWDLLTEVVSKFGVKPTHTLQEITLLKSRFPNEIKLFEARRNEEILAGIVIYNYGHVIHTQYMANSAEGRKLGALDYINHYLMNDVYKEVKYYSFGISTEDGGRVFNAGLMQQKEMMGSRAIVIDHYKLTF